MVSGNYEAAVEMFRKRLVESFTCPPSGQGVVMKRAFDDASKEGIPAELILKAAAEASVEVEKITAEETKKWRESYGAN